MGLTYGTIGKVVIEEPTKLPDVFDEFTGAMMDPRKLIQGIKKYDFINHKVLEWGYTSNKHTLCNLYNTEIQFVDFKSAMNHSEIAFHPSTNYVYFKHGDKPKIMSFNSDLSYNSIKKRIPSGYLSELTKEQFKIELNFGTITNSYIGTKGLKYTFGVELETNSGYVPKFIMSQLNMKSVRDGSVTGMEGVTGILAGDSGLNHLKKICYHLKRACTIDHTCGVHVHIGGFNPTKLFTCASYKLGLLLQDEIFSMLPKSRLKTRNTYYLGRNRLTCCGKLSDFDEILDYRLDISGKYKGDNMKTIEKMNSTIFKWLSDGRDSSGEINKLHRHPATYPNARYVWLNHIVCNFSRSNNERFINSIDKKEQLKMFKNNATLEFRNHNATLDYEVIKNWILICMAIVNYSENFPYQIINATSITLEEVLRTVYGDKFSQSLIEYIELRKKNFLDLSDEESARIEDQYYDNENKFSKQKNKDYIECV